MVQKAWQGATTSGRGGGQKGQHQGANSLLSFVNRAKESKDDLFRRNCGFLTEAEEARWEGPTVKTVGNAGEYWAGKARCLEENEHRLEEWLDWSEGEVGRKLVGESSVSATFARILAKCRAGGFTQPQVQQQMPAEVVEIVEDEEVAVVVRQEKKKPRGIASQSPSSKQGKSSQGSRQGSILSYFTAGKSQKQACSEVANQVEVIDLESDENGPMLPIIQEEATFCETREEAVNHVKRGPEVLEPAEAELLDSLFDFDSGYDSPTKPTFGALPDLENLVLEPCSKEELEEIMTEAKKKYLWPPEDALEVQVFPMEEGERVPLKSDMDDSVDLFAQEQDMSDDMFNDDFAVLCDNKAADEEDEAAKAGLEVADFILSSPEVDEVVEEQVGDDQSKEEMFPDVSQDMFAASFDLGSPLVEGGQDNEEVVEEEIPALPSSPIFDLGSPLLEDEKLERKPSPSLFDLGSPLVEEEEVQ